MACGFGDRSCDTAARRLMVESALEAHGVAKVYRRGAAPALAGLDLAIPCGSITALVGPNGAGKSTLMKAWMGFERPTKGHVTVHGLDPFAARSVVLRSVGYIPQRPALYRELTVGDHLDLVAALRPSFDRKFARRRLDDLGIPADRLALLLSVGQQAQVHLALVLAGGADTYLLDEPLADLDPLARREFLYLLVKRVREQGGTAVLTSHVATDVEQAADRIVVLSNGHKILDADVAAILATHRVYRGDAPSDSSVRPVASFLGLDGVETLVEVDPTTPRVGVLRPAGVEDVMLGYLSVGRPGMVEAVQSGTAGT